MDAKKAKGNTNLVVSNQPLFVLVDNVVTRCFISTNCVHHLGFEAILLPNPMVISSVTDDTIEAQLICRNNFISFKGCEFLIDLIFQPHNKIDVILGMDW